MEAERFVKIETLHLRDVAVGEAQVTQSRGVSLSNGQGWQLFQAVPTPLLASLAHLSCSIQGLRLTQS